MQCDSIIMGDARISSIPAIVANHVDAQLIHEAAIGRIAGDQILKLMTLGLTEQTVFPEVELDGVEFVQGMDVTLSIINSSDEASAALLEQLRPEKETESTP